MTKDNFTVLCPAENCKKVFDNRERFVQHCRSEHKLDDLMTGSELNAKEVI